MPRKIIYSVAISADGFIGRPDGAVDWLDRPQPKDHYGMGKFFQTIDTCVAGRKTYDFAVAHGMPDFYPGMTNYVFSRSMQVAPGKVELVRSDVKAFAQRLRKTKGKDIWLVGGAELASAFLDAAEIDEVHVKVIPVLIREGIPLFGGECRDVALALLDSQVYPDGVVALRYAPAKPKKASKKRLTR